MAYLDPETGLMVSDKDQFPTPDEIKARQEGFRSDVQNTDILGTIGRAITPSGNESTKLPSGEILKAYPDQPVPQSPAPQPVIPPPTQETPAANIDIANTKIDQPTPVQENIPSPAQPIAPPSGLAPITTGLQQQQQAVNDIGLANKQLAEQEYIKNMAAAKATEDVAKQNMDKQNAINDEHQKSMNELQAKTNQWAEKGYGGFWQDKSMGQQILAGIAVALGSGGGPDRGMALLQKNMDKDYQMFQDKKAKELEAINQSKVDLGTKRKLQLDTLQNTMAYRIAQNQTALTKLDEVSSKIKSQNALKQADLLRGQLQTNIDNLQNEANKFNLQMAEKRYEFNQQNAIDMAKAEAKGAGPNPLEVPITMNGKTQMFEARDREEAKRLREDIPGQIGAIEKLKEIKALSQGGVGPFEPKKIARIKSLINQSVGGLRVSLTGPGAMSEGERALILDTIGDPTKWLSTEGIENTKLDQLIGDIDKSIQRTAQSSLTAKGEQGSVAKPSETQLSPQDKEALDWANSNPNDPRSQKIKQKLGR